jgi:hypothetical protein
MCWWTGVENDTGRIFTRHAYIGSLGFEPLKAAFRAVFLPLPFCIYAERLMKAQGQFRIIDLAIGLSWLILTPVHREALFRVRGGSRPESLIDGRLSKMSNFYCHPGRAGGPPLVG